MKKLILLLIVCAFCALSNAGPMEKAVNAALNGPEIKKHKVYDHKFNIKQIEITRLDGKIIINGHISHHLRFRRDDQVYFTIIKSEDKIIKLKRDINRGGWAPVAAPIVAALGTYYTGTPIPPEQVEEIGRSIGRAVDGSWEKAADAIIANIAIRAK